MPFLVVPWTCSLLIYTGVIWLRAAYLICLNPVLMSLLDRLTSVCVRALRSSQSHVNWQSVDPHSLEPLLQTELSACSEACFVYLETDRQTAVYLDICVECRHFVQCTASELLSCNVYPALSCMLSPNLFLLL